MTTNVTVLSPLYEQKQELARLADLATSAADALAIYRSDRGHHPALAAEFQGRIDATIAEAAEVAVMIAITEGTHDETAVGSLAA
jgi:hypothetical protein